MPRKKKEETLSYQVRDIFAGGRTIFTVISTAIGAVMMGNVLWRWSMEYLGDVHTFFFGMLLLVLGGFYLGFFKD